MASAGHGSGLPLQLRGARSCMLRRESGRACCGRWALLEQSCRLCPGLRDPRIEAAGRISAPGPFDPRWGPGVCVDISQPGAEALADTALQVMKRAGSQCPVAHWAACLITMQYSSSTRPLGLQQELLTEDPSSTSYDLHPFPFWSDSRSLADQLRFHANFMSGTVLLCDDMGKTSLFRGRAVLRAAHNKEETHCAARIGDMQLVRRCRSRKKEQVTLGMRGWATLAGGYPVPVPSKSEEWLETLRCPTTEEEDAFFDLRPKAWRERSASAAEKYGLRSRGSRQDTGSYGLGCEEPSSEWHKDLRPLHKCVFIVIMERLQLPPGALVLDWGAGCGHKLTWAAQLYDVQGVGIDIVPDNIRWAREHSVGFFCQMDGRFLSWIPDDTVDAVISYAALMHLEPDDQCLTVLTLVEKVRVGGRLWFGWNAPLIRSLEELVQFPESDPKFWNECFATASARKVPWSTGHVAIQWETVLENYLFPAA
eukprot:s6617_g1.t5